MSYLQILWEIEVFYLWKKIMAHVLSVNSWKKMSSIFYLSILWKKIIDLVLSVHSVE